MERKKNRYCMLDGDVYRPVSYDARQSRRNTHAYRWALVALALHVVLACLILA